MPPDLNVSLETQIPEDIHRRVQQFLDENPAWHYDDFVTCALSMFLIQMGNSPTAAERLALDRQFYRLWGKTA